MSTLHDLRSTLDHHAGGLDDTERYVRPVAVRARVRAVRRRRAGLVAAAAAVVLLAGAATADAFRTPGTIQPAGRVVVGIDVPGRIDVLDFPYALRDLHDLDDTFHIQPSDQEQAVILAASGLGSGSATLYADGVPVARVRGHEQAAAPCPIGDGGTELRVRFSGAGAHPRAGVAVYAATGELAPGVSNGEAVFRDEYAGQPLLGAAFAKAGAMSATFDAYGAIPDMRLVPFCEGGGKDVWVHLSIDGQESMAGACKGAGRDLATGSSGTWDDPDPARDHWVRVYLTRGDHESPAIAVPGARFGAAAYRSTAATATDLGIRVDELVERDGRTWRLDRVLRPRGDGVTVETSDGDLLLGVVGRGRLDATWEGDLDHGGSTGSMRGDGVGSTLAGVLLAGDRYQVRATGDQVRLLVYRPE